MSIPHQIQELLQEEEEVHILLPDVQPVYEPRPSVKPFLTEQVVPKYRMKAIEE